MPTIFDGFESVSEDTVWTVINVVVPNCCKEPLLEEVRQTTSHICDIAHCRNKI